MFVRAMAQMAGSSTYTPQMDPAHTRAGKVVGCGRFKGDSALGAGREGGWMEWSSNNSVCQDLLFVHPNPPLPLFTLTLIYTNSTKIWRMKREKRKPKCRSQLSSGASLSFMFWQETSKTYSEYGLHRSINIPVEDVGGEAKGANALSAGLREGWWHDAPPAYQDTTSSAAKLLGQAACTKFPSIIRGPGVGLPGSSNSRRKLGVVAPHYKASGSSDSWRNRPPLAAVQSCLQGAALQCCKVPEGAGQPFLHSPPDLTGAQVLAHVRSDLSFNDFNQFWLQSFGAVYIDSQFIKGRIQTFSSV